MNNETATLLEKHFDLAFAGPKGVQKLRELILTLAMQGKLVPQDPTDRPVSELLKDIEAEKQRLVKEKIKQPKAASEIKPEDCPYKLPTSWEWTRLSMITTKLTDGSHNPPRDSGIGYPMLSSQNVNFGKIDFMNPSRYVDDTDFNIENKRTLISSGDVLLTIVGSLGRSAVVPDDAPKFVLQRSVAVISTPISSDFLCKQFISSICTNYYSTHGKGTAQKGIYLGKLGEMLIALPPLAEQHRIVAKIEQLMARCDELETLGTDRTQKRTNVHTAAIDRLLTAKADIDFNTAWNFITQHFGELYSVKENVTELRKAILQLAVMGKLVPQDPIDEPASELLKAIELEKQRLVKERKIKKSKPLPAIKQEEVPYIAPHGWIWIRLGEAGAFERGRSKHRPRNDNRLFLDGKYPFVQTGDVSKAKFTKTKITTCSSYYNDFGLQQSRLWDKGTLCITIAANIAETGFLNMEACIPGSVVAYLSIDDSLSNFVKVFIDVAKGDLEHFAPSTAQKNINLGIINDLIFPLPPLAEQHRIVAKVDRLMELCDRLDQQIEAAKTKQTELLNSLMAEV